MILVMGDIHGGYANLEYQIRTKKISDCSIIQVGDFGIGISYLDLDEFNKNLKNLNINMYVIRGNHDDPSFFKGNHIFSNLKFLPDYTQMEIDGYNILFVGGAISIDRKASLRKMALSAEFGINNTLYWKDEIFVLDEEKLSTIRNIDIVITHTAPTWCFPIENGTTNELVSYYSKGDESLLVELLSERLLVNKLFQILKDNGNRIKKHYYGHFHRNEITLNGGTEHILLGIGELVMIKET